MGLPTFFKWIESKPHFYKPSAVYVSKKHSLLVDFKGVAYDFSYGVPTDCCDVAQEIANKFIQRFGHFDRVVFVNDGKINEDHLKFETSCKRKRIREKVQNDVSNFKRNKIEYDEAKQNAARWMGPEDVFGISSSTEASVEADKQKENNEAEKWEYRARAARGVDFEMTLAILEKLSHLKNFECLQCQTGEADIVLIARAHEFDFVVSNDSDMLIGGVKNLLRDFGTTKQALYNAEDVLTCVKLTKQQLQEMACVVGNDYCKTKIQGMGMVNAYSLIRKYGECATMIQRWEFKKSDTKFTVPPDFENNLKKACALYNPDVAMINNVLSTKTKFNDEVLQDHAKEAAVCNLVLTQEFS